MLFKFWHSLQSPMGIMEWTVVCLLLLSSLIGSYAQTLCTLITPGVLHADTDETIILDGHNSGFEADITVQDYPDKKRTLAQKKISVNSHNDFLGKTTIHIKSQDLLRETKRKYYVFIHVHSSQCSLEKPVLVTFHSGYIFIQTDKTIYTPGSKVLYRIYPLNSKMQAENRAVTVEFKNSDGIVARTNEWVPDKQGLISKTYELPELERAGTWTITARYDNTQEFSAHFEVKEYVLPMFEVTIKPEKSFMYLDAEEFSVTIESQYLYKEPVVGKGFVVFGLKKGAVEKTLPDTLRRIEISGGKGVVKLQRKDLLKSSMIKNPEDLLEYKLYVVVTVITDHGSDFVEAKSDDIYIVKSPYKIVFFKTSKYFKPRMPFELTVMVTNPDGSPAKSILVKENSGDKPVEGRTNEDGIARLKLNTASGAKSLTINVRTDVPDLASHLQGSAETTVVAYRPLSGQENYLYIGIKNHVPKPKDEIYIDFNIFTGNTEVQKQVKHFTYLVLSRGRIMKAGKFIRKEGQPLVSMPLYISVDLMPSFRIVAYYTVINQNINEIVSDSVWVDVVDDCMGTLTLEAERNIASPQAQIKVTLKADYKSTVGLVAVDKGVFVLNSRHKLTQRKVWDTVEKSDLGCSPGSGADNMEVFYDAGLAVQTNFQMTTKERIDESCKETRTRKKRSSAILMELKTHKASTYAADLEKQCCSDGMATNPMGHSCDRRARHIQDGDKCVKAFLECCRYFEKKLKDEREQKKNDDLDRSEDDHEYLPDAEIRVRSDFPESWLWNIVTMDEKPVDGNVSEKDLQNVILKDSITTWELLAVSLSEDKGICVAKPLEIQVFQRFFIDLRLPYSVVRNEQVEIRAIIYNYESSDLQVRVTFAHNPEFCSHSTAKKPYATVVLVKKNSSFAVPFVIVPLTLGQHHVEVKASVSGHLGGDGVKKMLKVVPEGIRTTAILASKILEPEAKNGEDVVNVPSLANKTIVPDSPTRIITSIQGNPIDQFIEDAIDGANLTHLIIIPTGCAEQNMRRMTAVVIATHYLDKTNQWDRIELDRRAVAIENIQKGYGNQLTHRSEEGYYGSFSTSNAGTWLTAYVVKVFAMAKSLIDINNDILCSSVKWLILRRQKPDGMFHEDIPISGVYVKGGLEGSTDPDVSMTAFVVISLLESQQYCSNYLNNLQFSIHNAVNFIADRYQHLKNPYSVAITSYALALAGRLKDPSKLLSMAKDESCWHSEESNIVSIEATSYALLSLLKMKAKDALDPVVRWLIKQRFYGETYASTQATMMLYQALVQYQLAKDGQEPQNMDVIFKLPGRRDSTKYRINVDSVLRARSEETNINEDFVVKATGRGKATLTVMAVYYEAMIETEKECKDFDLSVTVANETHDAGETVSMNICFRYRKNVDATMTIIDVSMMTGFTPDENDLKNLMNRVDKYISYFEINKLAVDKGSLIIYLDRVSHTEEECLKFRLKKDLKVGLVQPGSVTIYEYYSPEMRCHKFYHTEDNNQFIGRLCYEKVCQCAEGNCLMNQNTEEESALDRMQKACDAGMDYTYRVSLQDIHYEKNYDKYTMQIKDVFKRGLDEIAVGNNRIFISHIRCREKLKLKKGEDYIIFGTFKSVWNTKTLDYTYVLGSDTWIEWWPNDRQCQDSEYRELCETFARVTEELEVVGCQS